MKTVVAPWLPHFWFDQKVSITNNSSEFKNLGSDSLHVDVFTSQSYTKNLYADKKKKLIPV